MNIKNIIYSLLVAIMWGNAVFAAPNPVADNSIEKFTIEKGTTIKVYAIDSISSRDAKQNATVHFAVDKDVKQRDTILITAHTPVEGIITEVTHGGSWGRNGKIVVTFSKVITSDGHIVPVTGMLQTGGEKTSFLVRYSLLDVFIKGKDAVINAGTEVNLQVQDDPVNKKVQQI